MVPRLHWGGLSSDKSHCVLLGADSPGGQRVNDTSVVCGANQEASLQSSFVQTSKRETKRNREVSDLLRPTPDASRCPNGSFY